MNTLCPCHLEKHLNICDGSKFFWDEDNPLKKSLSQEKALFLEIRT